MATEKRLIDATPIIDECKECSAIEWNKSVYTTWAEAEEDFMQRLLDAPTVDAVDAVEVVHGWWIELPGMEPDYKCSECGRTYAWWEPSEAHYCPNCGAKMDGDGNG